MHVSRLASFLLAAGLAFAGAAAQERPPAGDPPEASQDRPSAEDPPEAPEENTAGGADGEEQAPGAPGGGSAETAEADDTLPDGAQAADAEEPPYTVECGPDPETGARVCQVDRDTYVGWRTFHAVCHTCHAQDAVGSTFAPDLLPRIRMMDKAHFVEVVDQGFTGQVGVMPAWGMNPNVNKYYDELWAYLRARADGVLLPGRPKRLPD